MEAMDTLAYCIQKFGELPTRNFMTEVWAYIRTEALRTESLEYVQIIIEAIKDITAVVCSTPSKIENLKNIEIGLVRPALSELRSPEVKFAALYARMIYSASHASKEICELIAEHAIPQLVSIASDTKEKAKRAGVLIMFTQILEAAIETKATIDVQEIAQSVNKLSAHSDCRIEWIETIARLIAFNVNVEEYFGQLLQIVKREEKELRERAFVGIEWIQRFRSELVRDHLLVPLLSELEALQHQMSDNDREFTLVSAIIARIGVTCPTLAPLVVTKLLDVLQGSDASHTKIILRTLHVVVENDKQTLDGLQILDKLLHIVTSRDDLLNGEDNLQILNKITSKLSHNEFSEDQQMFVNNQLHMLQDVKYTPLVSSILLSSPNQVEIPNVIEMCTRLTTWAIESDVSTVNQAAAHSLASIVNKLGNAEQVKTIVGEVKEKILNVIQANSSSARVRAVYVFSWIVRSLSMRGLYAVADPLTDILISWLDDTDPMVSRAASDGFSIIMSESNLMHKEKTFAREQVLYRQRFFSVNIPKLHKGMAQTSQTGAYLLAFAHMIHQVPQVAIVNQIDKLFPIIQSSLVQEMKAENKELVFASLKTIQILLEGNTKEKMIGYLSDIVPHLVKWSSCTLPESVGIRVCAIECLEELIQYPYDKMFPYRKSILEGLEKALGDRKRTVRRAAVRCRNNWFTLTKESK
jgi:DNA repair/transcription protein MET18/MMS19